MLAFLVTLYNECRSVLDVDCLVNWCERQIRHGSDEVRVRCHTLQVAYLGDCSCI